MMFNGLLMCADSDASDVTKDSGATSSLADSRAPSAACDATLLHYQNKLMATLQVLQNKEETISTQAESLAVAEQRIATLSERARELKKELEHRTKENTILRKSIECKAVQKSDVCVVTDRPLDTCTCEDNMKWRKKAEALEIKVGELRQQLCELERGLSSTRDADMKSRAELRAKEQELAHLREQLLRSQDYSRDQSCTIEDISMQLAEAKASLCEKTAEVTQLRQENEKQAKRVHKLQEELSKAEVIIEENCKMRSEVSYLSSQAGAWRAQLDDSQRRARALQAELARAQDHAAHIDCSYREKVHAVSELQAQLQAAHARATELCGEARRAVAGVRLWARRMRDKHRELENIQKEKDSLIAILQRRLEERQHDSQHTSGSENIASCSCRDEHSFCPMDRKRWRQYCRGQREQSANEMPSCSSTPAPLRLRKKTDKSGVCQCDAALQQPERREASCGVCARCERHDVRHVTLTLERNPIPRNESPIEQVLLRVEQVTEALADGTRRWKRSRDAR